MKKIILFLLIYLSIITLSYSQEVLEPRGISTDPDNPVNPEKPEFDRIDYFFDWREPDNGHFFNVEQYGADKILSPFNMGEQYGDHPFIDLSVFEDSDYQPIDGWELVKHNLGTKMDGTLRQYPIPAPYIILYNKYSSTLRVFIADDPNQDWQAAIITISYLPFSTGSSSIFYDGERYFCSAMLSCNSTVAQPLSERTELAKIEIPTTYFSNAELFMWVDIPVTYDPCVCVFQSTLNIDFEMLSVSEIELTGSLSETKKITTDKDNNSKADAFVSGFTSTLFHIAGATAVPNPVSYALVGSDIVKLISILADDPKFDSNEKAQFKAFKKIITNTPMTIQEKKHKGDAVKMFAGYADFFSATIAKYGSSSTSSASMTISSMELEGTSTTTTGQGGDIIVFSTPGSLETEENPEEEDSHIKDSYGNTRPEYTYYNEILGTFALLKKPKASKCMTYDAYFYSNNGGYYNTYMHYKHVQIKINSFPKNEIEYVFNPAANVNIENTKIFVAIQVENINPISTSNLEEKSNYISPFVPLNRIANLPIKFSHCTESAIRPGYSDIVFGSQCEGRIYLKFIIEYEFNTIGSDGEPNRAKSIFKYPVQISDTLDEINTPDYYLNDTTLNPGHYSSNKIFNTFGDVRIEDNSALYIDNNSDVIFNIDGNLILGDNSFIMTETGSSLTINLSGDIIKEGGFSIINPNVSILYKESPIIPFDHEIPPITNAAYLQDFCENEYQAKFAKNPPEKHPENLKKNKKEEIIKWEQLEKFIIYPNPANKFITINFIINSESNTSLTIYDVHGKAKKQLITNKKLVNGNYTNTYEISDLQPGVYFITIKTNSYLKTKRLIII